MKKILAALSIAGALGLGFNYYNTSSKNNIVTTHDMNEYENSGYADDDSQEENEAIEENLDADQLNKEESNLKVIVEKIATSEPQEEQEVKVSQKKEKPAKRSKNVSTLFKNFQKQYLKNLREGKRLDSFEVDGVKVTRVESTISSQELTTNNTALKLPIEQDLDQEAIGIQE